MNRIDRSEECRKIRIEDRVSRDALAAILRELRYQRRRSIELAALCNQGLTRLEMHSMR